MFSGGVGIIFSPLAGPYFDKLGAGKAGNVAFGCELRTPDMAF
jgi:hypothetical protein